MHLEPMLILQCHMLALEMFVGPCPVSVDNYEHLGDGTPLRSLVP